MNAKHPGPYSHPFRDVGGESAVVYQQLVRLQAEVQEWGARNFPNHGADHAFAGMVEELGELSHARLKTGQKYDEREGEAKERDALGDLLIYALAYASHRGWSLQRVLDETWAEVRKRDFRKFPKDGGR